MMKKIALILVACLTLGTMSLVACSEVEDTDLDSGADSGMDDLISDSLEDGSDEATDDTEETEGDKVVETDKKKGEKPIDIYIIAGQSNAAGYTVMDKNVLAGLWSNYNTGTQNVLYKGRAEGSTNYDSATGNYTGTSVNEAANWTPCRAGFGGDANRMGPEVGMAKVLGEKYYNYNQATGENRVAGILKFAHGGTSLLNNTTGQNADSGNWVSPSYAAAMKYTYRNNVVTGRLSPEDVTGNLYRKLLAEVEEGVDQLKALGYDEINIKGVFWMQGESDRGNPSGYQTAFKYFAKDLRRDLGEIMGENLSFLPIIIGEISETTGSAEASSVTMNKNFISMQGNLGMSLFNVYIVNSGKYHVNWLENGVNKNGQDAWHWTTADMFNIGVDVGECILKNILKVR